MNVFEEFFARYSSWCLALAQDEVAAGCPHLRQMNTAPVMAYLETISSLPNETIRKFALGLAKRRLRIESAGLSTAVPALTEEENSLVAIFDQIRARIVIDLDGLEMKIARRKLRSAILDALHDVCGPPVDSKGATWYYCVAFDQFSVRTDIDLASREADIVYWHRILHADRHPVKEVMSFTSFLGIEGGQARWQLIGDENLGSVAQSLKSACSRFLDNVPTLLDGLSQ